MSTVVSKPEKTLAIVLGAKDFPKAPELASLEAFTNSAEAIVDYLLDPEGFGLPRDNLLNLFDNPKSSADIDEELSEFLRKRVQRGSDGEKKFSDLIFYYVGHGGFASSGADYYLAVKATRSENPEPTSYTVKALARTIKTHASHLRRFIILDSCFSAAAYREFQSGPLQVAVEKTLEVLPPEKGTALLCASGPRDPARTPLGSTYTMFSGALLESLRTGIDQKVEYINLVDLSEDVARRIFSTHDDEAVRPQIHFPDQSSGSIGKLPIFPNQRHRSGNTLGRIEGLEAKVELISKQNQDLLKQTQDLSRGLSESNIQVGHILGRLKGEGPKSGINSIESSQNKKIFIGRVEISEEQWNSLPGDIKSEMLVASRAKLNGYYWATLCGAVAFAAGFAANFESGRHYLPMGIVFTSALALVNIASIVSSRSAPVSRSVDAVNMPWQDWESVVRLRAVRVYRLAPDLPVAAWTTYFGMFLCTIGGTLSVMSFLGGVRVLSQ